MTYWPNCGPLPPFAGPMPGMPSKFLQAFLVSIFLLYTQNVTELHRSSFSRRALKFALVEPSFGSKNVFHHCFHGVLKFSTAAPTPLHALARHANRNHVSSTPPLLRASPACFSAAWPSACSARRSPSIIGRHCSFSNHQHDRSGKTGSRKQSQKQTDRQR